MGKRDLVRMQEHALERAAAVIGLEQHPVKREIAVFVVTKDRKARRCEVYPDLVGTPGFQLSFQQGELLPFSKQAEHRMRLHSTNLNADAALAFGGGVLMQRQLDVLARILPVSRHHGEVALVGQAVAHLLMQVSQR